MPAAVASPGDILLRDGGKGEEGEKMKAAPLSYTGIDRYYGHQEKECRKPGGAGSVRPFFCPGSEGSAGGRVGAAAVLVGAGEGVGGDMNHWFAAAPSPAAPFVVSGWWRREWNFSPSSGGGKEGLEVSSDVHTSSQEEERAD